MILALELQGRTPNRRLIDSGRGEVVGVLGGPLSDSSGHIKLRLKAGCACFTE